MRLNKKYAVHSADLTGIVRYLTDGAGAPSENADRLDVSAEEVAEIGGLQTAFAAAYAEYIHPNTHNEISVQKMKIADDNAFAAILPLRQRLKNGRAELTSADYANLGIHKDKKTRTRAEVPTDVPQAILTESRTLSLTFDAIKQTPEGAHRRVALQRRWRIAREIAIVAQGIKPADGDFHSIDSIGRARFTMMFSAADVGKNAYLRIAYENNAGRGPFSLPVKAVII